MSRVRCGQADLGADFAFQIFSDQRRAGLDTHTHTHTTAYARRQRAVAFYHWRCTRQATIMIVDSKVLRDTQQESIEVEVEAEARFSQFASASQQNPRCMVHQPYLQDLSFRAKSVAGAERISTSRTGGDPSRTHLLDGELRVLGAPRISPAHEHPVRDRRRVDLQDPSRVDQLVDREQHQGKVV